MSKLVIVESPAKAKTIKKYLGSDYEVMASMGHIRDLPRNSLGVNVQKNFRPQYLNIDGKEDLIKKLKAAAKNSDYVYLATDPDREGEAISWHLAHILGLSEQEKNRVTFGEITKTAVQDGMKSPRAIDEDLVDAQQARRILDRIVGYKLSPFLWRKVRRGLSAGRVQSVAVRLLVDREREIEAFDPEEYWIVEAVLRAGGKKQFTARLRGKKGETQEFKIRNKKECDAVLKALEGADYIITDVKRATRKRSPEPPFITSTLQQDAARKLGFTSRRTMRAAQELYEGVDVEGVGSTGLITYMRTDSVRVADGAHAEAVEYITAAFGADYAHKTARKYRQRRAVEAQNAHEAIRPTSVELTPEKVSASLSSDQLKIYKLIWERFVASRMADQQLEIDTVDIEANGYEFRASGHKVLFDGFTKLYEAATDEKSKQEKELPELATDTKLALKDLLADQKFTQPPQHYNEATLIKALEENGIGRPSTYAPIIGTIIDRGYVERKQKQLVPTALGMVVTDLMIEQFPDIVDVKFSAGMEKNLDRIEEGKADWVKTLDKFYQGFEKSLTKAEKNLDGQRIKVPDEETDVVCELCGRKMVVKNGRYGKFLACPGYPECKNTKRIEMQTPGKCPKCGANVVGRRSSKGRLYYACEKGQQCGFMTWNEPTAEVCPQCGSTLFQKKGRAAGLYCEKEGCGYKREIEK